VEGDEKKNKGQGIKKTFRKYKMAIKNVNFEKRRGGVLFATKVKPYFEFCWNHERIEKYKKRPEITKDLNDINSQILNL